MEISQKKPSTFVVLSEENAECGMVTNVNMATRNQSVSIANSGIDSDGNHNGS